MLNVQLDLQPETEQRLKKLLAVIQDQEAFAQHLLDYHMAELKKAILNIRLDLRQFEDTYHTSTAQFYQQFQDGARDDREDFLRWAGLYEMLCENERRLQELT
ncbi:hypothetical protein GF339_17280 [candidate division KSB3 bacterium]|uniref:Uncharacterized protein n=1 Tax=candidate division KSB3 bacterium TaxID=2044937 RepID=A0A9D5Q7X6_9BACT|nr:hypothetical protein [candidate division KSB3 bacterium]MBD3326341.1 hypothetical protein [candidate division KSB3 bacterium]